MTERNTTVLNSVRQTQLTLEQLYELEAGPDVSEFVHIDAAHPRETLLVRQPTADSLELALLLPADLDLHTHELSDAHLQVIEGVSHFVLLTERARTELPATRLELEIQAEVDKFALLLAHTAPCSVSDLWHLHHWLFERVAFLHEPQSEDGARYRTANDVAARLCSRLCLREGTLTSLALLRRFYRSGQAEKIWLASAA